MWVIWEGPRWSPFAAEWYPTSGTYRRGPDWDKPVGYTVWNYFPHFF